MKGVSALVSGLAGAVTLTLVHEAVKRIDPQAPRMDLLGMNALSKLLKKTGQSTPDQRKLFYYTMAGDLISNALYYSLAGVGKKENAWLKGGLLGAAAGIGAVALPRPMGLNEAYSNRTTKTKVETIALYLIGGLVTSAIIKAFGK